MNNGMKPNKEALVHFLKEIDNNFYPALSIKTDLNIFADKLLRKAVLFYELDNKKIIGLVAMYANDYEKQYAYISLVGVLPSYRQRGIAKKLLREAVEYVGSQEKIRKIGIHTNNPIALRIYCTLGFKCIETVEGRTYLEFLF